MPGVKLLGYGEDITILSGTMSGASGNRYVIEAIGDNTSIQNLSIYARCADNANYWGIRTRDALVSPFPEYPLIRNVKSRIYSNGNGNLDAIEANLNNLSSSFSGTFTALDNCYGFAESYTSSAQNNGATGIGISFVAGTNSHSQVIAKDCIGYGYSDSQPQE